MELLIPNNRLTYGMIERFEEKRKQVLLNYEGLWIHNVPFYLVSVEVVLRFRGQLFTPEEFYLSDVWTEPSHWNAGFVENSKIVIFMYGYWSRLDKYVYTERIAASPTIQSYGNRVWEMAIAEGERIAREKGCKYIWTTTFRKGEVKKFLEVEPEAVLNPSTMMVIRKDLK